MENHIEFTQVELTKDEYALLSRMANGEFIHYSPSAETSNCFQSLKFLGFIQDKPIQENGTIAIETMEFSAHITEFGKRYLIFVRDRAKKERRAIVHNWVNTALALAALIVSILALRL